MSHLGFTEMYKYTASYLSFYDLEKFSSILHHPQESTVIYFSDGIPTVFFLHLRCSHIINSHSEYLQLDVRYAFLAEIGKKQNQMYWNLLLIDYAHFLVIIGYLYFSTTNFFSNLENQ